MRVFGLKVFSAPFVFFLLSFFPFSPQAAETSLASDSQWLALGHYRRQWTGGYRSTIDSPGFFVSSEGKTNPQAELNATIELFEAGSDEKKICLFPARYAYLRRKGLVTRRFPECREYRQFLADVAPAGITLLFTDAYMNNPSSLFGHTLIRIDTARKGTQLLAHGMNYGAFTGDERGVLFAVYGLTGGYYGGFTLKPYYDIINTYNNIENRDIWELQLNLTPQEQKMFVAHLWELGHAQSRYYFFGRNCSYMLMEALDAVRPSLRLADDFPMQTIPLDTVKAVNARPGLVKAVHYRPSRQSRLNDQYRQMTVAQKKAFEKFVLDGEYGPEGLTPEEQAGVAEAAYQFVQYQYVAKNIDLKDYRRQSFKLLVARNNLKAKDNFKPLTEGKSPLKTHDAMRLSAGAGVRNGQGFQQLEFRPAYHSLTDDSYGMLPGAEINFLNFAVRHYDGRNNYVLQKFDLVGIRSISPVNVMFRPLSYQIRAGIDRETNPDNEEEGYAFNLTAGAGGSYAFAESLKGYLLLNNHLSYGGFLPHNQWVGIGAAAGLLGEWKNFRFWLEAEKIYATSAFGDRSEYKAEVVYGLTRNTALALNYLYQDNRGHDTEESLFSFRVHF